MKRLSILAGCIAGAFAFNPVSATETLLVTAARTPVDLQKIASAITVIDRAEIINRQSIFVADLLRDVPSVSVSRAGTFGAVTEVRVRGAEANHVMVMIDGVKANDPALSDGFRFETLTAFDVQRIEVVRGPQSALWGSDAVAGVINVITREAAMGQTYEGMAETGSYGTLNGGTRYAYGSDRYNLDASLSWFDTDGDDISRDGTEDDSYDNLTGTLRGGAALTDTLNLNLFGRYNSFDSHYDETDPYVCDEFYVCVSSGLPIDPDPANGGNLKNTGDQLLAQGGIDHNYDNGLLKSSLAYGISQNDNEIYHDGAKESETQGDRYGIYAQSTYDFRANGSADGYRTLTLAVDYERLEFTQQVQNFDPLYGNPNQQQNWFNTGYVGEFRTGIGANMNVGLALRRDANSAFGDKDTWRVTASYLFPAADTRLKAASGTGQKNPTFTEVYGYSDTFEGNPNLKPEESRSWEVGVEQGLFDHDLILGATYFKDRLTSEINGFYFDPNTFKTTAVNEAGISHRQGVELRAAINLLENLGANLSYTYLDADQPDGNGGTETEVRRPENMAAANINYAFLDQRANVNFNVSYNGSQDDVYFPGSGATNVTLDSYTLVSLAGSYQVTDLLQLTARVENLLDEDYEDIYGYNTPGVGVYGGFRVRFGE